MKLLQLVRFFVDSSLQHLTSLPKTLRQLMEKSYTTFCLKKQVTKHLLQLVNFFIDSSLQRLTMQKPL
jgi:hypothetical protein